MTTLTSKTAKHTPGPWVVSENKRERTIQIDTADGKGTVVQPNAISWKPDAALIAAAPAMLEAIKHALRTLDNMTSEEFRGGADRPLRDLLNSTVAKAEGRS